MKSKYIIDPNFIETLPYPIYSDGYVGCRDYKLIPMVKLANKYKRCYK